ncbi:MAG: hypothetical protein KIT61_10275 [Pyrinomonadaceae bacterium]|nr:hypothetical protein [Blastocatellia bacterium]MCW5956960.1 hypothetical protein [Pyrinomonadaceae bacterium]
MDMFRNKGETGMACFGKETKALDDIRDAYGRITASENTDTFVVRRLEIGVFGSN